MGQSSNGCTTPFCTQNIQAKGVGLMRIRSDLTSTLYNFQLVTRGLQEPDQIRTWH